MPFRKPSVFARSSLLTLTLFAVTSVRATLLTGSIVNYPESEPFYEEMFGDGTHSVALTWSVNMLDRSGFFYRSYYTEVAVATGVSSINQITDASIFSFTTPASYYRGPVFDVGYTGGLNSFIILKSATDGYYGVVRIDDIFKYATPINHGIYGTSYSGLNATWWFQSDGTANFATVVPEPMLLGSGGLWLWFGWILRRQKRHMETGAVSEDFAS